MTAKILVVDDHEVVHQGIRMILQARPDWEICGQAANGVEAVEMAQRLRPDAIVMDITMPVMNGLEATRQITHLGLSSPVLIFTMHESKGLAESVRSAGGRGLVLKSRASRDLIEALERILSGGTYYKPGEEEGKQSKEKRGSNPMRYQALHSVRTLIHLLIPSAMLRLKDRAFPPSSGLHTSGLALIV
jgi:DNA-binding NarL/FixJ family response regulator